MRESLLIRAGEEGGIRVLYRSKVGTPFSHVPGLQGFLLPASCPSLISSGCGPRQYDMYVYRSVLHFRGYIGYVIRSQEAIWLDDFHSFLVFRPGISGVAPPKGLCKNSSIVPVPLEPFFSLSHRDCPMKTHGANERARGTEA